MALLVKNNVFTDPEMIVDLQNIPLLLRKHDHTDEYSSSITDTNWLRFLKQAWR